MSSYISVAHMDTLMSLTKGDVNDLVRARLLVRFPNSLGLRFFHPFFFSVAQQSRCQVAIASFSARLI